jgi:L-threonylcarbamoyladenylate synthase
MSRTQVLRPSGRNLAAAVEILRAGGLVAFPTETVYGLGARAYDASAARRVYKAKGRPSDNPLIVHICDESMLHGVVKRVTPLARKLMGAFWPGPLTLILEKSTRIPDTVTAGGRTVAVRCPGHAVARALIRALGEPVAAPSANRSGRPSPTTAAHVLRDLPGRVPLILDGGPCRRGLESTIVDARGRRPVILRPGTISTEAISRACGSPLGIPGPQAPPAPGARHRHYAPSCRVILVSPSLIRRGAVPGAAAPGAGLLHRTPWPGRAIGFSRRVPGSIDSYAAALFAALRAAETAGVKTIYVETVVDRGVGRAVMDRLRRAARR